MQQSQFTSILESLTIRQNNNGININNNDTM